MGSPLIPFMREAKPCAAINLPDRSRHTPPPTPMVTAIGGVAVDAGGIELRQRVGLNYGYAVFADAGRVGETALPFSGKYAVGLGAGVRYYTPIGPLRVDIGLMHRLPKPNNDSFELYIGLGQSF